VRLDEVACRRFANLRRALARCLAWLSRREAAVGRRGRDGGMQFPVRIKSLSRARIGGRDLASRSSIVYFHQCDATNKHGRRSTRNPRTADVCRTPCLRFASAAAVDARSTSGRSKPSIFSVSGFAALHLDSRSTARCARKRGTAAPSWICRRGLTVDPTCSAAGTGRAYLPARSSSSSSSGNLLAQPRVVAAAQPLRHRGVRAHVAGGDLIGLESCGTAERRFGLSSQKLERRSDAEVGVLAWC